jgi:hypothetical protein
LAHYLTVRSKSLSASKNVAVDFRFITSSNTQKSRGAKAFFLSACNPRHRCGGSCWARGIISIPEISLISNIGYSVAGTHTTRVAAVNRTPRGTMSFPLKHPPIIEPNFEADRFTEESFYYGQNVPERLFWKVRVPLSVATVHRLRRWAKDLG